VRVSDLLDFLLDLPNPLPIDGTEADARALIIDPLLRHLGWDANDIKREPYAGWTDARGFIDYLLMQGGKPLMVLEAKKTGRSFGLPQVLTTQRTTTYRKIRASASANLVEALDQCLQYAQHTGAIYACATNGADWIFELTRRFRIPSGGVDLHAAKFAC
jgi:predicted type IV restriction endonuclease